MAANMTSRFKWDAAKEKALWLLFDGKMSQAEVAENVGVATRTCERWIAHPVFRNRLEQMRADLNASLKTTLYVSKESRLLALADMAQKARHEFEARPWLKEVRPTKDGFITNEHFNEAAFAAFRGALDDIAKEKGERTSKVDVKATFQGSVTHDLNIAADATISSHANAILRRLTDLRSGESGVVGASGE